ncbi:MAG: efflux RND transporter permease subunit [Gemmatimonadaceae bacterium]
MSLARAAVTRPVTTVASVLAIVLLGSVSLGRTPVSLLPDVQLPVLTVRTVYTGAAAEEVSRVIAEPVEEAIAATPGLVELRSISRNGEATTTARFAWGTDMQTTLLNVRERLDNARSQLPERAARPLPIAAPNELVNLTLPVPIQGSDSCNQSGCGVGLIWSYPMLRDLERQQTVLAGVAGYRIFGASLALGDEPTVGEGNWVTGADFSTLGLRPALGRLLHARDNEPGADNMVAVVSTRGRGWGRATASWRPERGGFRRGARPGRSRCWHCGTTEAGLVAP